jgi:hypothetical protein
MVPLAFLILCMLAFGLLLPWLGFFWDDWPVIATLRRLGIAAFWEFYKYDRPFSAWTYVLSAPLLGSNQLLWHTFTLLLRWLTVVGMWWSLRLLWPARLNEVTWMAFLFAIYPTFTQQPVAVAFSQHWISFCLYFLSIGLMLLSLRKPSSYVLLTTLSLVSAALHMLTMEYFIGLELLRPVLIWIVLADKTFSNRIRLRETFLRWLPFLLVTSCLIIWRLFFMQTTGEDPNRPVLLYSFFSQPAATTLRFLELVVREYLYDLAGSWFSTINPSEVFLTSKVYLASLALLLFSAVLAFIFLNQLKGELDQKPHLNTSWSRQAILLGLLAVFLGSLPGWLTDRQALSGLYGGRFGMAAMFGASILVVGLLDWITPRRLPKIILVSALVGMAVGFHLRSTTEFVKSWTKQSEFYWQLAWRAPYIQPGTALLSPDEIFPFVGRYSTSMALNLLYPRSQNDPDWPYWFVELPFHYGPKGIRLLLAGKPLDFTFRNYSFTGKGGDSLAIYYEPDGERCLWVLSQDDLYNPDIPEILEDVLPISNLGRIVASPASSASPSVEVFGKEPAHTWCYYYQKADLARQQGDWQQVVKLAEQAEAQDLKPANPHERLPLIEAYANTGQWAQALDHTRKGYEKDARYAQQLCYLWENLERNLELPVETEQPLANLKTTMRCKLD